MENNGINSAFNDAQIFELNRGMDSGVDIGRYRRADYRAAQMRQIRLGLEWNKAHPDKEINISGYDNHETFTGAQMEVIRIGLMRGVDVKQYAHQDFNINQMWEIMMGLCGKYDVSRYADPRFDAEQMQQIRLGLEKKLDVAAYADPKLPAGEMERYRGRLEAKKSDRKRQKKLKNLWLRIWAAIRNTEGEEYGRPGN